VILPSLERQNAITTQADTSSSGCRRILYHRGQSSDFKVLPKLTGAPQGREIFAAISVESKQTLPISLPESHARLKVDFKTLLEAHLSPNVDFKTLPEAHVSPNVDFKTLPEAHVSPSGRLQNPSGGSREPCG